MRAWLSRSDFTSVMISSFSFLYLRSCAGESDRQARAGRHRLGVGARVGRLEIDDVAQEDLSLIELVAPDDDGLEGQRALAQPGDHRLAAGLDALGDRDLALAREQLDRAHFAQIHAHRVVGALRQFRLLELGWRAARQLDDRVPFAFLLSLRALLLLVQ